MNGRATVFAAVFALAACAGRSAPPPESAAAAHVDTLSGSVATFGVDPMSYPVLQTDAGALRLAGPLSEELGHLTGAAVRVWGSRTSDKPQDRLEVAGYAVESVNGRPVHVGVLAEAGGAVVLRGDREWRLVNAPDVLARSVGAKVYVAGPTRGDSLTVESWGVIRRP